MTAGLTISIAAARERPVLENLVQLYIHDFSALFSGTPRGDLSDDGRYAIDIPLDRWWSEADHVPLLLRVDGRLAGFVLLNGASHGGAAVDRSIAEFFVVRKYRRSGIGTAAAGALFSRYPGHWEAAVMRRNDPALAFWTRCIGDHPALGRLVVADVASPAWDGTVFRFDIAPA